MGVEGPVLMPLDGASEFRGLHVELMAVLSNGRADQSGDNVEYSIVPQGPVVDRMLVSGHFEPPQSRVLRCMARLQVEHFVVVSDLAGFFDKLVGDPAKLCDLSV